MTELEDPIEIYRRSLAEVTPAAETAPPIIERAEAWPYPDLARVWVRVQISPFAAHPNLSLAVRGPDDDILSSMFIVELQQTYQSVTLHLRRRPAPGAACRLEIELSRDEQLLDRREVGFDLVFVDPAASPAS